MPVRSTVDQVARRVYCFCPKLPSQPSLEKNASRSFQQCLIHAFCHTILLQRMSNSVVANNPLVLAELIELRRTKFQTIISSSESESSASATVVEPLASPFLPSFFFFSDYHTSSALVLWNIGRCCRVGNLSIHLLILTFSFQISSDLYP